MELSLSKTKNKLESHEQLLRALDKQFKLRNKRTNREDIRDPVHEEFESHLETIKDKVKVSTHKWKTTKGLIDQLKSLKHQMHDEYRCEPTTARINDACLKVTARKAMELDRMDARGGRCKESSRKKRIEKDDPFAGIAKLARDWHIDQPQFDFV